MSINCVNPTAGRWRPHKLNPPASPAAGYAGRWTDSKQRPEREFDRRDR